MSCPIVQACRLDGLQASEGLLQCVAGDLVLLDVQRVEDGLVEEATLGVVAAQVEGLGILQQGEGQVDEPSGIAEFGAGVAETALQLAASGLDLPQLELDLPLRHLAIGCQVEQVLFLGVQGGELAGELLVQKPGGGFVLPDGVRQVAAHLSDEGGSEADRGVMLLHRILQPRHVDVRRVAGALLLPPLADEVQVCGPVSVGGLLHDHALGEAAGLAGTAEQRALEVVVVDAPVLLGGCSHLDDVLHLLEELLADKGLVTSGDLLALEFDHANVVAVAQQVGQPGDGDGLGRSPSRGPCTQSAVVQLCGQVIQRVLARGVQLEGQADERSALGIDDDRSYLVTLHTLGSVEVADRGAADGAAVPGLVGHLGADVLTAHADLQLVEDRQGPLHGVTEVAVAEVLLGGDERDAHLGKLRLGGELFQRVPEGPAHHVDDDVLDVRHVR